MTYRYGTAHRKARDKAARDVEAGHGWCCEPVCLMSSRWIAPGSRWHLSHNPAGTMIIGVSHSACNLADGGRRSWGRGVAAERTGRLPQPREPEPEKRRWRPGRLW